MIGARIVNVPEKPENVIIHVNYTNEKTFNLLTRYLGQLKEYQFEEFCKIVLSLDDRLYIRVLELGMPEVVYCDSSIVDITKHAIGRFVTVIEKPGIDKSTLLFQWGNI